MSRPGAVAGVLFFVLSLLPSLLTRGAVVQGIISGIALMVGYAFGAFAQWAWSYLEIPVPHGRAWRVVRTLL